MNNYDLTPENINRLERLAAYLDSLPYDYSEFSMSVFLRENDADVDGEQLRRYALYNGGVASCGTAACAVGHGPSAGILVPAEMIYKSAYDTWEVDWVPYSELFTGPDDDSELFNWLFGDSWSKFDNHHYGAAARIKYVLADVAIPDTFGTGDSHHVASYADFRKEGPVNG